MATKKTRLAPKLQSLFESAGARVDADETFQERYGIDFIVTRFQGVHAHVNLGVHVTTERDALEELESFSRAAQRGVVLKAIYVEVPEETVDSGGLLVAYGSCLSFLFDRVHAHTRSVGVRIAADCSFQHFDLEDNVQRLQRMAGEDELHVGQELEGRIIAYFTDKGFGFIQTDDERKYFFHIANVEDDELRVRLPDYVPGEVIPVDFQYGGNEGKKYPKALGVVLTD